MKLNKYFSIATFALLSTKIAFGGFTSINGVPGFMGMVCEESENSQIQLTPGPNYSHILRRVISIDGELSVTNLTKTLYCKSTSILDEPTINNRCNSISEINPDMVKTILQWNKIHLLIKTKNKTTWMEFDSDKCRVEVGNRILPMIDELEAKSYSIDTKLIGIWQKHIDVGYGTLINEYQFSENDEMTFKATFEGEVIAKHRFKTSQLDNSSFEAEQIAVDISPIENPSPIGQKSICLYEINQNKLKIECDESKPNTLNNADVYNKQVR